MLHVLIPKASQKITCMGCWRFEGKVSVHSQMVAFFCVPATHPNDEATVTIMSSHVLRRARSSKAASMVPGLAASFISAGSSVAEPLGVRTVKGYVAQSNLKAVIRQYNVHGMLQSYSHKRLGGPSNM